MLLEKEAVALVIGKFETIAIVNLTILKAVEIIWKKKQVSQSQEPLSIILKAKRVELLPVAEITQELSI